MVGMVVGVVMVVKMVMVVVVDGGGRDGGGDGRGCGHGRGCGGGGHRLNLLWVPDIFLTTFQVLTPTVLTTTP